LEAVVQAVLLGMLIVLAATIPRNMLFMANLRYDTAIPWSVPLIAVYLWLFWRYVQGAGPPESTAKVRRTSLRANPVPGRVWAWALLAGGLGLVALVLALRVANRLVALPEQQAPDLSQMPALTVLALLLMSSLFAGVVEESAFRGYMQGPIERRLGLPLAILITGTMFAIAHLDFTWILWPYYVTVAAIYGIVTHLARSIFPAVVLHASGNVYSNLTLWLTGRAEWQTSSGPTALVWSSGADRPFLISIAVLVVVSAAMVWAYFMLARAARNLPA
jgi:membrane protease YdiL (CAAX protease family)